MKFKTTAVTVILRLRQSSGRAAVAESYYVAVEQAPVPSWGGPFLVQGLDDGQVQAIRALYRDYLSRYRSAAAPPLGASAIEPLRTAGSQLFLALPETVQNCLHQAEAIAQSKGQELCLVLAFESTARPLLSLPWESLHNPSSRLFYALRGGGVSRQLLLPAAPAAKIVANPRSILGLWAEPATLAPLTGRRQFDPAPGRDSSVLAPLQVAWVQGHDSLTQLEVALDSGEFDGLHIVAHGRGGAAWSDFNLALVSSDGSPHWLSADSLTTFLAGYPALRFVYLDICSAGREGDNAYAGGLAADLVSAGVPYVLAMQDDVTQTAAGLTAQVVYRSLAQTATPEEALTAARRAVRLQQDDPIHWSVPALYRPFRQPEERDSDNTAVVADWLLNRTTRFLAPANLIALVILLMTSYLSHTFAQTGFNESRALALLGAQSMLLPFLGALAMRQGHQALAARYGLDWRGWAVALRAKYEGAAIWALMSLFGVVLIWFALAGSGLMPAVGTFGRQVVGVLSLLTLAGSGYLGARQGMRQNLLFWREKQERFSRRGWFLFLALPALLLMVAMLLPYLLPLLAGWGGAALYVLLALLLWLAAWLDRSIAPPG
jgi:hypothetical protein